MHFQLFLSILGQHRNIAPRLGILQHHRLIKQLEPIYFFNRLTRRLDIIKDDKCLSLCFKVALCDDLQYGAVFGEDFGQGFD